MMSDLEAETWCENLARRFPDLASVLDEHLRDNDSLLPHVFMGDVTRYVLANGRERRGLVQHLEESLALGGEIEELVALSFVENLPTPEELAQALADVEGPRIRAEWQRQRL
jgi:hypothetical protein